MYKTNLPEDESANHDKRKRYKHPRDTFHAYMLDGAMFDQKYDMPLLKPETIIPNALVPFSVAKLASWSNFDCAVHFCERDQDIEPFWNRPLNYIDKLLKFQAVMGLDLSTCVDFPRPQKEYNVYRNRVCDVNNGNARLADASSSEKRRTASATMVPGSGMTRFVTVRQAVT